MTLLLNTTKKFMQKDKVVDIHSFWFWISIVELLFILFLVYKLKFGKKNVHLTELEINNIKKSRDTSIDMNNLMDNIHNSRNLYKELSRKCHPERFVNDERQVVAEGIFKEISENERNYEKLCLLKLRAETELNIKF